MLCDSKMNVKIKQRESVANERIRGETKVGKIAKNEKKGAPRWRESV